MNPGLRAHAKPFPFTTLETLTRADVLASARLRRVAGELVDVASVESALAELLGERVSIVLRRHRKLEAPRGADDAIGVVLTMPDEHLPSRRVLVEVEGTLGAVLTAKALRQRAPRIVDPARAVSAEVAGAVAAVLVAVVRRAHAGGVAKVIAAGPGASLARDLLSAERNVTISTLSVTIGEDAFEARVYVPEAFVPPPRDEPFSRAALASLGDARIALPLVVTTTLATRAELAALAPGDAFVPAHLTLDLNSAGELVGAVALVAPRSERGLSADLAADGRLVVRGLLESHPWESVSTMPSEPNKAAATATIEALEEAPVVVRVELGAVEMMAREWSELAPGDVVSLGRRLGEPAILRVGGVELARGELVQVDGEYAVRILSRSGGGETR